VALVIPLLALEVAARFVLGNLGEVELLEFWPPDGRTLGLKPGAVSSYDGYFLKVPEVTLEVNELGFRGPAYPRAKPYATYRIALLGDSYTYGVGVEENETSALRLEPLLSESGRDVEVLNFGIPGANAEDLVTQHPRFISRWHPDLLILQVSPNDLDRPMFTKNDPVDPAIVASTFRHVYAARVLFVGAFLAVKLVLSPFRDDGVKVEELAPAKLEEFRRWLAAIRESTARRRTAFAVAILGNPVAGARMGDVLEVARTVSGNQPLDASFLLADPSYTIPNEGHLNARGHERLAKELSTLVNRLLASDSSAREPSANRTPIGGE
jgi:lysophospholipase L1-like esterase